MESRQDQKIGGTQVIAQGIRIGGTVESSGGQVKGLSGGKGNDEVTGKFASKMLLHSQG